MVSLKSITPRFDITLTVIQGGSGIVRGSLSETDQSAQPSYVFVQPRHVLRTVSPTAVRSGMVLQSPGGDYFIVGDNGPSEMQQGTIWDSFRLFEPTGLYAWQHQTYVTDVITQQKKSNGLSPPVMIYAALEPLDRQVFDRKLEMDFEQKRFITGANVQIDDLIDNHQVTTVDKLLGLSIGVVT